MTQEAPRAVGRADTVAATPIRRVVIPVGGTSREFVAQEQAVEMAAAMQVPLVALHVRPDPDRAPDDVFQYIQQQADKWGVPFESEVLADTEPAQRLLSDLDSLDLLVIGTRRMGRRYHFGSVTEELLRHATCMIQVVRLDE